MTPQPVLDPPVPVAFPDILALSLDEITVLMPLGLDEALQRVLPDRPVEDVELNSAFASSI